MKRKLLAALLALGLLIPAGCGSSGAGSDVDIDLTKLSATMVYSEVFNMLYTPEDYLGKTINMEGTFTEYYDETQDRHYYACIIQDATACCAQGIEFVLADPRAPEEYPEEGSFITVRGVFDVYEEDGYQFVQLVDAAMR